MILYNKEVEDTDELDYIVSMIEIDLIRLLKSRNTYKMDIRKCELNDEFESLIIKCKKFGCDKNE